LPGSADRSDSLARSRSLQQRARARREQRMFARRLGILLGALVVLIVAGTIAFTIAEGTSIPYSFAWTLNTITTLGSIRDPTDTAGRIVVVALELFGIGTLFYGLVTVAEFFVSGQLSGLIDERRTQRMINSYHDHYIICGFGRVGRQVARDLRRAGVQLLVIDSDPSHREEAAELRVPYVESYAAEDEVLLEAGIKRARAVVACVDSDADNIFIALTARELRPDILIVARASAEDSEKKLLRAGADRVISPYKTSGTAMARLALHPQVGGAVDVADFRLEEIQVAASCGAVGRTIEQVRGEAVIVAIRRSDGRFEPQPSPESVIDGGDMIVAIGRPPALERLETQFEPVPVTST
jgi:voltage-gated potassium channel